MVSTRPVPALPKGVLINEANGIIDADASTPLESSQRPASIPMLASWKPLKLPRC